MVADTSMIDVMHMPKFYIIRNTYNKLVQFWGSFPAERVINDVKDIMFKASGVDVWNTVHDANLVSK